MSFWIFPNGHNTLFDGIKMKKTIQKIEVHHQNEMVDFSVDIGYSIFLLLLSIYAKMSFADIYKSIVIYDLFMKKTL